MRGFYFITDSELSRNGNISDVEAAVGAGCEIVQYRNKDSGTEELIEEARRLKEICKRAIFIVNDRVDIAAAVGADGVHLGQDDASYDIARQQLGEEAVIGITVHNVEEARAAEKQGADYLGVSPIFKTTTKPDAGEPAGIRLIRDVRAAVAIPIAAVGGINLENAPQVVGAGADMLCAISAVVTKDDVKEEIEKFQVLFAING